MTVIGRRSKSIDWLIQPGVGIAFSFEAKLNGVPWDFPTGTTSWVTITDPKGCNSQRIDFEIDRHNIVVRIPESITSQVQERAKILLYVWYPTEVEPILWGEGRAIREGW